MGRVGDDLLPRLDGDPGVTRRGELGMVRFDGRQRLRDREPVWRRGANDVERVVRGRNHDPGRIEGRRVHGWNAGIAAVGRTSGPSPVQRGGTGARSGGADNVDPLSRPDPSRGPSRFQTGLRMSARGHPAIIADRR